MSKTEKMTERDCSGCGHPEEKHWAEIGWGCIATAKYEGKPSHWKCQCRSFRQAKEKSE